MPMIGLTLDRKCHLLLSKDARPGIVRVSTLKTNALVNQLAFEVSQDPVFTRADSRPAYWNYCARACEREKGSKRVSLCYVKLEDSPQMTSSIVLAPTLRYARSEAKSAVFKLRIFSQILGLLLGLCLIAGSLFVFCLLSLSPSSCCRRFGVKNKHPLLFYLARYRTP